MPKKKRKPQKAWRPKGINYYLTKWDRRARRHFGHSKATRRRDRRANGKAQLTKY